MIQPWLSHKSKILMTGWALLFFLSIYNGLLSFSIWSQVLDFFLHGSSYEWKWFHAPRAFLVFPSLFISDLFQLPRDRAFSFEIFVVLAISAFLTLRSLASFRKKIITLPETAVFLFLYSVAIFQMNGRLAFCHLSFALLLNVIVSRNSWPVIFLLLMLSAWLSTVSSGLFLLFFLILCVNSFFVSIPKPSLNVIRSVLLLVSLYLAAAVIKNLQFYELNVLGILRHGYGNYIPETFFIPLGILFLLAGIFFFKKFRNVFSVKLPESALPYIITVLSLILSVTGQSIFWGVLNIHFMSIFLLSDRFLRRGIKVC